MRTFRRRTRSRLPTLTSLRPPSAKSSRRTKWRPRLPTDNRSRRRRKDLVIRLRRLSSRRRKTQLRLQSSGLGSLARADVALRRRPSDCVTKSTANSSPRNPASSAAEHPRKSTTFAVPHRARSAARSATNTRSPSAGFTTAFCMDTAMMPHGRPASVLTLCQSPSRCGDGRTRPRLTPRHARSTLFPLGGAFAAFATMGLTA